MELFSNLGLFFQNNLKELHCEDFTRAYIQSIFCKYKSSECDFSKESITLRFYEARTRQDFVEFQNIADWLFFAKSLFPEALNNASIDYFDTIAKNSYYSCYRLINRQLVIYENLADEFEYLTDQTRKVLINRNI